MHYVSIVAKKLACGNPEPSFPPMAFLFCGKQSSGLLRLWLVAQKIVQQAADASCRQNGN